MLAAAQKFTALAVTGLSIAAAALDHPLSLWNIPTAALGDVGSGIASACKWRNFAGKAAFHEEALSVCVSGADDIQLVLDQKQLLPQPAHLDHGLDHELVYAVCRQGLKDQILHQTLYPC